MSGKPFYLGLTMAGAISAGAYSAGVFDFLIQALQEWENAKNDDRKHPATDREIPDHSVIIPVLSGASAGGMTAALGVLSVANRFDLPESSQAANSKGILPALYEAWVESISFTPRDNGLGFLLDVSDLEEEPIRSLLDATVISEVAGALVFKARHLHEKRPFLARPLHLFLATTNLRGVPYRIAFTGTSDASGGHVMTLHGDRIHFEFADIGRHEFTSPWLAGYAEKGVQVSAPDFEKEKFRRAFLEAALCTGAFPIGLPARLIERLPADFSSRAWPYQIEEKIDNIEPQWPLRLDGSTEYHASYAGSDGGIVDNEPFELARWTLMATPGIRNVPDATKADRAVLMIDPFPEMSSFDPELSEQEIEQQVLLRRVISSLLPALKNQARVKAIDLARASKGDVYSRFLIAPSRKVGRTRQTEEDAADPLASGVFAAFGGFLDATFPAHDYQLGRRNCQQFLRLHLVLPHDNEVVKAWPEKAAAKFKLIKDGVEYRPIIPLCNSAAVEVPAPSWPRVDDEVVEEFLKHVRRRGDALVKKLAREELTTRTFKWATRLGWLFNRRGVLKKIRLMLTADLIRRDQHVKWAKLKSDLDRLIIAELFEPASHARTTESIARSINRHARARKDIPSTTKQKVQRRLKGPLAEYVVDLKYADADVFRLRSEWRKPPFQPPLTVDGASRPKP